MALTVVVLTVAKITQRITTAFREKLNTSLLKIRELFDLNRAVASEAIIANLESQIDQLTREVKELKCKNVDIQGMEQLVNEEGEAGHVDQLIGNNNSDADNEENELYKERQALMNVLILETIARHLKLRDIQTFRLVCQRWRDASETVFWKFSRIKVKNTAGFLNVPFSDWNKTAIRAVEEDNNKLIRRFENTFTTCGMPSDAIAFDGFINRATLDYFWRVRGSMALTNIYFQAFCEPSKECIDLTYFLNTSLRILTITNSLYNTKFKVSLEALANIKSLHLADCEILLNGKIAPTELKLLESCTVKYEGKIFELAEEYGSSQQKILINDFVDFSKIKELHLCGNIFKLDVGLGTAHLEHFDTKCLELIGLHKSRWTTNSYYSQNNICVGARMEIRAIDHVNFDLRTLPLDIEGLAICYHDNIVTPHIFMYPKLKYCCLKNGVLFLCPLLDFTNCTLLLDIALLEDNAIHQMDFNQIVLPSCVKRVHLRNVDVITDAPWQLDVLYLDQYSLSFAKSVLQHISTIKLKLEFDTAVVLEEDKTAILNFWKTSNIQQFAFGPIEWSDTNTFLNSEFSKTVNKPGSHFLFTKKINENGKVIDSDTFNTLSNIDEHGGLCWPLS